MNTVDPLAQLRDIHLPEPISWWPPAPGWWVLLLIALTAVAAGIFAVGNYILRNRYRRAALREMDKLAKNVANDPQTQLQEISILLRRVAIQAYGREEVAPLFGKKWLAFLDRTGNTDRFSHGAAKILGSGLYQSTVECDMDRVIQIVQSWIKEHRR